MKNKLITGVIMGIILLVAFVSGASAMMNAEDLEAKKDARDLKQVEIGAEKDAKKEEVDAKKEEIKERRCEQARNIVQKKIEKFNGNNKYHQKNFNEVEKNVEELVVLFKSEGLDTSDLESYLAVLKTKLEKLYVSHDTFIDALEALTEVGCSNVEEGKNKIQTTRKEAGVIRVDVLDIKDYYKNTVRPELIGLRSEYLELIGEEEVGEDEELENKED